ncbi:MAG: hypothetical protein DCF25_22175 [Leptolyngbya foveolarum]|uniref:Uncharacterized protein n=1 Tax=Leptolyngbya foveolarum TaxID=47253 RepID=A0A2W4TN20_9CYAN|nr:MAG: hypothetical protein DCF25_22175 [Leptolyngbya foveolarum]
MVLEAAAKGVALVAGDFSGVAAFQEKSAFLIETLLKYVDDGLRDAIRALSACRAFDFEIYQLLGEKLSFVAASATFQRLVNFSFVRQMAQGVGAQYRIHDLLRRLDRSLEMVPVYRILAEHYELQGDIINWIYYNNRLD